MGSKSIEEVGVPEARHHLFVCVGPKCCSEHEGEETWKHIKSSVKEHDLPALRTKADCFRICSDGPWLVVYPEGVWYAKVTPKKFDRIRREHLEGGVPVQEWVRAVNPLGNCKGPFRIQARHSWWRMRFRSDGPRGESPQSGSAYRDVEGGP